MDEKSNASTNRSGSLNKAFHLNVRHALAIDSEGKIICSQRFSYKQGMNITKIIRRMRYQQSITSIGLAVFNDDDDNLRKTQSNLCSNSNVVGKWKIFCNFLKYFVFLANIFHTLSSFRSPFRHFLNICKISFSGFYLMLTEDILKLVPSLELQSRVGNFRMKNSWVTCGFMQSYENPS